MVGPRENQYRLLAAAVDTLAVSHGSVQERLLRALPRLLDLELWSDLPEGLHGRYEGLMAQASNRPAVGDEGTLQATLLQLSNAEAEEFAREIVSLREALEPLAREESKGAHSL